MSKILNEPAGSLPYDDKVEGLELKHLKSSVENKDVLENPAPLQHAEIRSAWEEVSYRTTLRLFWKGALVCFLAAFSFFTDGYHIAVVGNIIGNQGFLNQMGNEISKTTGLMIISANDLSAWGAVGSVMQWLGMNVFPFVADRFGRKVCMCSYWVIIAAGVACESAARNWKTAAKVCQGLGVGAMQFCLQMYITELSPTSTLRGMMLSCYNFWWTLGLFIGTIAITIEHNKDPLNWLTIILTQWSQIGLMGIIYFFLLPESPWWHARKGMHDKAIRTLRRLYGSIPNYSPEEEYAIIRKTIEVEEEWAAANKEIPWLAVVKGVNGWRTLISSWELRAGAFIGQTFLSTRLRRLLFRDRRLDNPFANKCITSALGILSVIFLVVGLDYVGRRRIVCYAMTTQWVSLPLIGCLGEIKNPSQGVNGFLIFLACLWSLCFYTAAGAGWSLVGEVSTARLRARTSGFAAGAAVLVGIPLGYAIPYMISANSLNWGLRTCFFYAGLAAIPVALTWFIIPETAHRSPAELDEMFEAKVKPWRFRKYVTEVQKNRTVHHATVGTA